MSEKPRIVSTLPDHSSIAVLRARVHEPSDSQERTVVHPHAGIGVCLEGTARFWMGRDYHLRAGDLVVVPDGMPHFSHGARPISQIGLAVCPHCLRGDWGDSLRYALSEVRHGGSAVRRLGDRLDSFIGLFERIEDELTHRRNGYLRMVDGLMLQLVVELERARPITIDAGTAEGSSIVVMRALEFITQRAAEAISLNEVAQHVGRSAAHLTTIVKDETGQTVVEWITTARMARARDLLSTTDETVATIADAVGYASPSHFHRTFRRVCGATPGAWRAAHRH